MVTSPRSRASDSIAIPTDDVPPRISRLCPGDTGPNASSDPHAVKYVSGSAAKTSHGRSVSTGISRSSGSSAYSAYPPSNSRPISPITAATLVPGASRADSATTPTHSMPSTRGNRTFGECPCRVISSDRFSPNPSTRTRVQPSRTSGTGTSRTRNTSGPPGPSTTTARISAPFRTPRTLARGYDNSGGVSGGLSPGWVRRVGSPCGTG